MFFLRYDEKAEVFRPQGKMEIPTRKRLYFEISARRNSAEILRNELLFSPDVNHHELNCRAISSEEQRKKKLGAPRPDRVCCDPVRTKGYLLKQKAHGLKSTKEFTCCCVK